jgi:hypothetical protein
VILLLVPTLGWLATAGKEATIRSPNSHLTEVVIPTYWGLPNQPTPSARIHKPKRPLPTGSSKMKSFGPPFTMDFTLGDEIHSKNASSLLPITMDSVFDGTFSANAQTLKWCAEDPDEGVFTKTNMDGDIVLEDVTHLRKAKLGTGDVAKGGGLVTLVKGTDIRDVSCSRVMMAS